MNVIIISVGFTGTRDGMTKDQAGWLRRRLTWLRPQEFHHGDCIGADYEAARIADALGIITVAHPADIPAMRAYHQSTRILPAKAPLLRNHDIVDACHLLLVAPRTSREELRSGTWATYRYAKTIGRPREVLHP